MASMSRLIMASTIVTDSPEYQAALPKGKGKEVVVSFELDRQGRVSQVFVDRPSGSRFLDRLAERIISSGQYPPFPEGAWPGASRRVFTKTFRFP
jgi:TonB family protein